MNAARAQSNQFQINFQMNERNKFAYIQPRIELCINSANDVTPDSAYASSKLPVGKQRENSGFSGFLKN